MQRQHWRRRSVALISATALAVGGIDLFGAGPAYAQEMNPAAQRANDSVNRAGNNADRAVNPSGGAADSAANQLGKAVDRSGSGAGKMLDRSADSSANGAKETTTQPSGMALAPADATKVRGLLAAVTNAAVTPGGFDGVVECLSKSDRDRIGEVAQKKFDDLDAKIAEFQKSWKEKFNQDFKLKDAPGIFDADGGIMLMQGDRSTSSSIGGTSGTQTATVVLPCAGQAEIDLRLANEGSLQPLWRIDLPEDIDGQKLHDHLVKQLTMIVQMKDQWPADVNAASRSVLQHVLTALGEGSGK